MVPPRELLTTMIGAAPKEYASTVRDAQRLHGSNLDIDLLEEEMRAYWQIAYGSSSTQDDDDEIALAAPQLRCYNCNAIGNVEFLLLVFASDSPLTTVRQHMSDRK